MAKKKTEDQNQLQQRMADLENQLKRAVADYRNLETRISQGRSELSSWATQDLIKRLLPVLDHLETVVEQGRPYLSDPPAGGESKEWFRGVELAVKELNQVLESEGLVQIMADGLFNPNLHEAVDIREGEDNMILEVVRKGYNLNGKVLRPARVVVGRSNVIASPAESGINPAKQSSSEEKGEESI